MEMDYKQIIQTGLELLKNQLEAYLETILKQVYGDEYMIYMQNGTRINAMSDISIPNQNKYKYKDVLFYLNAFIKNWQFVFSTTFKTNYALTLCHSIKYFRNRWAHQSNLTIRETYRVIDECQALLEELGIANKDMDSLRIYVLQYLSVSKSEVVSNLSNINDNNAPNEYCILNNLDEQDCDMIVDPDELDNDFINDLNYQKLILDQLNNKNSGFKISEWSEENH